VGKATGREWLRLGEAADALGVSLSTLRRWSDTGKLACYRSPGGHRRYRRTDVEALLDSHGDDRLQQDRGRELVISAGLEDGGRLDADDVLPAVARRLCELTNAPVAEIHRVDGDLLRVVVSFDGKRFNHGRAGTVVPLLRSPCSRRAVEARAAFAVSGHADSALVPEEHYLLEKWGYRSQLSIPLLSGGEVVGVIELSDYVSRDFTTDLDLVRGLSQVAANAMGHAALLDQADQRSRILNELVDLGTLASRAQDLDALLRYMAERLLVAVDAASCDIYRASQAGLRCVVSFDRGGLDDQPVGRYLDAAGYPTLSAAAHAHRVLVIDGWDDPQLTEKERQLYREYGLASEVAIPLVVNDRLYGLIDLYDTRKRDFSEYMSFLRSVGQTLAAAIKSSLLIQQVEERSKILREIVDLGVLTSQTRDPQELLRIIAARLRDTIHAADCDVFTFQGGRLRCLVSADRHGFDEEVVGDLLEIDRFPATAMAVRSREPMIISSLEDPRLTEYERAAYAAHGYQSELCVPLVTGEQVIGLIDIFDTEPRDYEMFIDYLRSVGQMAAGAMENALLVEELERRNTALAELVELGRAVSGADGLEDLAKCVGPRIVQLVGAAGCQIFTLQGDRLHCVLTYEDGVCEDEYVGQPLDLDLFPSTRDALARREVLVVSSADDERLSDHERRLYRESGSASEICVPLAVEDRVVGLLEVYDRRPRDYSEYRDFLVNAAHTLAGVVENVLLMQRLEDTNTRLNLLVESGMEFGETLELEPVLQSVALRLCAVTDAPACDIYTVEENGLRCVACIDKGVLDDSFVGTLYSFDELPLTREAVTARIPLLVTDVAEDQRQSAHERDEDLRWGHRAKLELPLVSRGKVVGVAAVFDDHPREFADLDLLQSLAQVAANALANATLFERLDRSAERMALVTDVSYELSSSLDLGDVLRSTALRLCSVAGTPACDVYTLRGDALVNVVSLEDGSIDSDTQGRTYPLEERPTLRQAVQSRLPVSVVSVDDPRPETEHARLERHGMVSRLSVPLVSKDRVIGVLELMDRQRPRTFSPEEIDTVSAVCRVAALAIDNADLVEDLQLRNRENELLNEIAGATSVSLDLPDIAAAAMEKLRQIVPFDQGLVALRRDEQLFDVAYVTDRSPTALPEDRAVPMDGFLRRLRDEKVVVLDLPTANACGLELPGGDEFRSTALVALAKGPELIGALVLGARAPGAFGSTDSHLLERTGTHLALAIDNARMYGDIKHMHLSNLKALSSALNAKDYYTLGHAARVAAYMVLLGQELGWSLDLLNQVEEAAYLHDIGKIGVSDRVLLKPSGLNGREWELMRQHPIFSADIIRSLFSEELVLGVRHHHERFEGGGYPDGLSGQAIPLMARAMCVADSYDAMSFRRPYRHGLTYHECIEELHRCRGTQFDPAMVDAFLRVLERLAEGREQARRVATEAASRIDPEDHALLRSPEDEARPEYSRILEAFREVCAENPPTRFISSHVRLGKKTAVVVDSGQAGPGKPHIGDEMMTDDELVEVFAGRELDANVLLVDQWGVWVSGTAPVLDRDGRVVAAVTADVPASDGRGEFEGLRSNVAQTFASMLRTAAVQAGRSEIEAITDGLTGLYNHRYFHERLSEEIDRCLATDGRVSLLFCDLDNFRVFNEKHGHSAGDQALRAVARVIESSVRHVDIAARFGGEEFAAILMDTDERGALEVAERIRAGLVDARLAANTSLSISIGVASCPQDAMFKEELIDKADWAMYLAKRQGRDQVMSFSARHGSDTPEQAASVGSSYVAAMSDLVAARDAYERRRRYAIAHLAQAVGAELDLGAGDLRAMAAASETDAPQGVSAAARRVLDVAAAYQAMVAERPYRQQLSEAEALDELLNCPALAGDGRLATAFEQVLSGGIRRP